MGSEMCIRDSSCRAQTRGKHPDVHEQNSQVSVRLSDVHRAKRGRDCALSVSHSGLARSTRISVLAFPSYSIADWTGPPSAAWSTALPLLALRFTTPSYTGAPSQSAPVASLVSNGTKAFAVASPPQCHP